MTTKTPEEIAKGILHKCRLAEDCFMLALIAEAIQAERTRAEQLQSECSEMRESLRLLLNQVEMEYPGLNKDLLSTRARIAISKAEQALQPTAGAKLLNRVKRYEDALRNIESNFDHDERLHINGKANVTYSCRSCCAKQALSALDEKDEGK